MRTPSPALHRTTPKGTSPTWGPRLTGWLLFALALALRLLFWRATPDAAWPGSAWYRGDAETWLAWARALQDATTFEVGLPIRPPGATYLIATLWNGDATGIATLKFAWCLIGALTVALFYLAALRCYGKSIATWVGLLCAGASGLMLLSTSLNNEAPYLLLVAATLVLWPPLWERPRGWQIAAWSALHALACLVRAEHLLYFVLLLGLLAWRWSRLGRRPGWRPSIRRTAASTVVFAAVLLPWHLDAWKVIERFNDEPPALDARSEEALRQVERVVSWIPWSDAALAELDRLPAATRRTSRLFVAATEGVRGKRQVEAGSLDILEQAFGSTPRPLDRHPYLVLYGPLNFYLANNSANRRGGFNRAPLERRPPLEGGVERYPLALVQQLPPTDLTLTYPPHLEAINDGYRLGWLWIRSAPGAFARLVGRKLANFWNGAALGFGGYSLPLGLGGERLQVDLVVRDPSLPVLGWRLALALLVAAGIWHRRRDPVLIPWGSFLLTKLIITVAFYGYARQGATVIPVVALFVVLAIGGALELPSLARLRQGRWARASGLGLLLAAIALLGLEVVRWQRPPTVLVDGRSIGAAESAPAGDHRDRRIDLR